MALPAVGPVALWLVRTLASVGVFIAADEAVQKMGESGEDEETLDAQDTPLVPGARKLWCSQWHAWRERARAKLDANTVANHFDPYWHQHQAEVCGSGATGKSAKQAVIGADLIIEKLSSRTPVTPQADQDSPPYIPDQQGVEPPNIIETPDANTGARASTLLPLLIIGAAVAAFAFFGKGEPQ